MHDELQEWQDFLRRDAHLLRQRPWLLFQQAANQPDFTAPTRSAQVRLRAGRETRPWLRWINKPKTLPACLFQLVGHSRDVRCCAWSPDGQRIASGSYDSTARLWDATTGDEIATLTGLRLVEFCMFSPDGQYLVAGDDRGRVTVWDGVAGHRIADAEPHCGGVKACRFSRNGTRLITAGSFTVKVRDARSGATLATLAHERTRSLAGSGEDLDRALRNLMEELPDDMDERLGELVGITLCEISPDGSRAALVFSDGTAGLWDPLDRVEVASLPGAVARSGFSPDGTRLAVADYDDTLTLWDAVAGTELARAGAGVYHWAFSPDGSRLATSGFEEDRGVLAVWDPRSGERLRKVAGVPRSVGKCTFSGDGSRLVTIERNAALLWDAAAGEAIAPLEGHSAPITLCRFSPDGTRVVTASEDATLRVFDAAGGRLRALLVGHTGEVRAGEFSPDGNRLVTASDDGDLRVWDAWWEGTADYAYRGIASLCRFARERAVLVTVHWDALTKLWDADTGEPLATLFGPGTTGPGEHYSAHDVCVAPDGSRVVCALTSARQSSLRMWDVSSQAELPLPDPPTLAQMACMFSPNGTLLVCGGIDGLTLRDGATGARLDQVQVGATITACDVSPDGRLIVAGSERGRVGLWEIADGRRLELRGFLAEDGTGRFDDITACAFVEDGERVLAATGRRAVIWNVATGARAGELDDGVQGLSGSAMCVSTRSGYLALGFPVRAWHSETLRPALRTGFQGLAVLAPDARHLLGTEPGGLAIWDLTSGTKVGEYYADGLSHAANWSPEGRRLAVGDSHGSVRLLDLQNRPGPRSQPGHQAGIRAHGRRPVTGDQKAPVSPRPQKVPGGLR